MITLLSLPHNVPDRIDCLPDRFVIVNSDIGNSVPVDDGAADDGAEVPSIGRSLEHNNAPGPQFAPAIGLDIAPGLNDLDGGETEEDAAVGD